MAASDYFGARLRELRETAGLTQQQLAERAQMTKDGIAQLEQGRNRPSWTTVVAISGVLGVSCESFLQAPARGPARPKGRPRKTSAIPSRLPGIQGETKKPRKRKA